MLAFDAYFRLFIAPRLWDLAVSLLPLLLVAVAVMRFHQRHRSRRTFAAAVLGVLVFVITATTDSFASFGRLGPAEPTYELNETADDHYWARVRILFGLRDVCLILWGATLILVLPHPKSDVRI